MSAPTKPIDSDWIKSEFDQRKGMKYGQSYASEIENDWKLLEYCWSWSDSDSDGSFTSCLSHSPKKTKTLHFSPAPSPPPLSCSPSPSLSPHSLPLVAVS